VAEAAEGLGKKRMRLWVEVFGSLVMSSLISGKHLWFRGVDYGGLSRMVVFGGRQNMMLSF
jgi:hypothetical protein